VSEAQFIRQYEARREKQLLDDLAIRRPMSPLDLKWLQGRCPARPTVNERTPEIEKRIVELIACGLTLEEALGTIEKDARFRALSGDEKDKRFRGCCRFKDTGTDIPGDNTKTISTRGDRRVEFPAGLLLTNPCPRAQDFVLIKSGGKRRFCGL